jgi:TM2 domain-containing membrane protein YozV
MHEEAAICVKCGVPAGKGSGFCPNCCQATAPEAVICVNCGVSLEPDKAEIKGDKSRLVAGLLGILLGSWGIHNFYLGFTKKAIIQIIVSCVTCGVGGLWGFIEGIMILCNKEGKDAAGNLLKD